MVSIGLAEVPLANELRQTLPKNNCSSSSAAWAQPYLYAVWQSVERTDRRIGADPRAAVRE
jgi:hypothetical protein